MSKVSIRELFEHIWRERLLRNILLLSVVVLVVAPGYAIVHVIPTFTKELLTNIEAEAQRTTRYLSYRIFPGSRVVVDSNTYRHIDREIEKAVKTFGLEKVKIFSADGTIVYSTDAKDEGTLNAKPYFTEIVRQGRLYSKIDPKQTPTAEGRIVQRDVAEVYVPVMDGEIFTGAFEVYYDITVRKSALDGLVHRTAVIGLVAALLMLALISVMLVRAARSGLRRQEMERALQLSHEELERRVLEQTSEIRATQKASIVALASLAENYDPDTGDHLERIQNYVQVLTEELRKSSPYGSYLSRRSDYIEKIALASVLHDIGKAVVPRKILMKPSRLDSAEFEQVKQHTEVAAKILHRANQHFIDHFRKDSYLAIAREIALHHHEKWSGEGYPLGLKGEDIPLSARIVALADVYDALRSRRPYKEAWSHERTVEEIVASRGGHFDPVVVDAFLTRQNEFEKISLGMFGDDASVETPKLRVVK